MSEVFNAAAQAISNDPALREKVMSATSAQERAAILADAGIATPSHEHVSSGLNALAGAAGGAAYTQQPTGVSSVAATAAAASSGTPT